MKTILFLVLLICFCTFLFAQSRNKATQEKLPGNQNFVVVYDNDDHRDVYIDEYLLALASIDEIDLKGIITTYSPSEYGKFVEGRSQIVELARKSGLQNLPEIWPGTNKKLVRPVSNKIENTMPLKIEGYDGQPAILISQPGYVNQWKKLQCLGINEKGYPVLEENELGKIWQAEDASPEIATSEFWRGDGFTSNGTEK